MEGKELIVRSSAITRRYRQDVSPQMKAVLGAINKIKLTLGGSVMEKRDALPMAEVWKEMLDRKGVHMSLYNVLVNMAVEHRVFEIANGRQPPYLNVELMLAMFELYKKKKYEEWRTLKLQLSHIGDTVYAVETGSLDITEALKRIGHYNGFPVEASSFEELTAGMMAKLQVKIASFLKDNYLEEQK